MQNSTITTEVLNPLFKVAINNKPFAIEKTQFLQFFDNDVDMRLIDKDEFNELRAALYPRPTHCMNSNCKVELKAHEAAYCRHCESDNQFEYNVEESI